MPNINAVLSVLPVNSTVPTITGVAQVNQALTEHHGVWIGAPTSYSYQWEQCTSIAAGCMPILGAVGATYTPTVSDIGTTIEVQETATNGYGAGSPAVSVQSMPVGSPIPVNATPPTITGSPEEGQTLAEANGTWSNQPTSYNYQWLDCAAGGSTCTGIPGATGQTYVPLAAQAGDALEVQEIAANADGPGAPATSNPTAAVKALPLKANAGDNLTATTGVAVTLDGTGSTPAPDITGYRWDFGDGKSGAGAVVNHTYASAGTYSAALTVTGAGGHNSASTTVTVSAPTPKVPTVTVEDASSHPIAGADVTYVSPDGTATTVKANTSGVAQVPGLPDGTDTVYAYLDSGGYLPAAGQITVTGGAGHTTIVLQSGAPATTTLKSHQMTPAEIAGAGIDTSDPANNVVYSFQVSLAFVDASGTSQTLALACDINSAGQFVGPCVSGSRSGGVTGTGGAGGTGYGGGWACSPGGCQSPQASVTGAVVDGHPLIQWLILQGKATVLKQFFDVSMVVTNLSADPFKLTGGAATLDLPAGMSLAPTAVAQTLKQTVPTIAGASSADIDWIIRGDTPGSYNLSAEYDGTLQPFGAAVQLIAGLASPLKVWGDDALRLSVQADSGSLTAGYPYHVRIGLTNNADVPLYNVQTSIDPNTHPQYIFQPDERFSDEVAELDPGQTVYSHTYVLVPDADSVGVFNPAQSAATFAGQTPIAGAGISQVPPPPVYALTAPTDTPGLVHLHWQPVPGATGYEVFSTPTRDTPFGADPLDASISPNGASPTELPASATDAYVSLSADGYYAVSSIVNGQPAMEHPLIAAQAGEAPPVGAGDGPSPGTPEPYVALGDSYSSGEGAPDNPRTDTFSYDQACHRSSLAWPVQLDLHLHAVLPPKDFLACSGDTTTDLIQNQLPLLRSLHGAVLTTVTIGGDDLNFVPVITTCALDLIYDAYCAKQYPTLPARVNAFEPVLRHAYELIKLAAGGSNRVIAVGYPQFFGDNAICAEKVGVFKSDRVWINSLINEFNGVAAQAASEASIRFVNPDDVFAGHRLCDAGSAYLNGPVLHPTLGIHGLQVGLGAVDPGSFHPNASGYAALAKALAPVADQP